MVRQFMNNWAAFLDHSLYFLTVKEKNFSINLNFFPLCMLPIYVFYVCTYVQCIYDLCILGLDIYKMFGPTHLLKNSKLSQFFRMRRKVKINYKSILLLSWNTIKSIDWKRENFSDEITNYSENMQFFKQ